MTNLARTFTARGSKSNKAGPVKQVSGVYMNNRFTKYYFKWYCNKYRANLEREVWWYLFILQDYSNEFNN